jgi:transaldolase
VFLHASPHRSARRCDRRPCVNKHHGIIINAFAQVVVCDSGDFATIAKYQPQDATTNPSLILAASKKEEYAKLIDAAVEYGKKHGKDIEEQVDATLDNLLVQFGKEILKIIPGKVSTEVDARFSFDTEASVNKALHIIDVSCTVSVHWPALTIRSCTRSRVSVRSAFSSR